MIAVQATFIFHCRAFGHKVVTLKTLLKKVMPLTEDRDKTVREETKKLLVELYRWIGEALRPQLSGVKPVMVSQMFIDLFVCLDCIRKCSGFDV